MNLSNVNTLMEQSHNLELQLVEFINKENAQFVETEEMKILQAYADTTRVLISTMYNECINPYRLDVRHLTSSDIQIHTSSPEVLLESLKMRMNVKHGANKMKSLQKFSKNIDKLIKSCLETQ